MERTRTSSRDRRGARASRLGAAPRRSSALALGLVALAAACDASAGDGRTGRPNVLLISLDSTRRDLLSCYGHRPEHAPGRPTSPNLDRLAEEGVRFRDAYSNSSWTLVSHLSLLSGQPPLQHGVDDSFQSYAGDAPLFAEVLQAEGYRTAGFFSGPLLEPHYGFGRGFERYEACYGPRLAQASACAAALREARDAASGAAEFEAVAAEFKQAKAELMTLSHTDVSSAVVTEAVLDELGRCAADERPFFLFAHYFDPHYDYVPPAAYDVFDEGYDGTLDGVGFLTNPRIAGPKNSVLPRERRASERELEHVVALYEAELAWTDAQVGRVLERLDALGLADDTLVVVTADHGDEFFEHGSIGHRRTLYEEVVQVPLILRLPGRLPRGRAVDGLVSLADVPATVLELVGIEPAGRIDGESAVELIEDDTGEAEKGRHVLYRVVQSHSVQVEAQGYGVMPATQFFVTDAFRFASIKITRNVSWTKPREPDALPADVLDATLKAQRSHEALAWIDVVEHPAEEPGAHASDFSDPAVRTVLAVFRQQYETLLPRRVPGAVSKGRQRFTAMLRGLGYVEDDELPPEEDASEDFVLPPPGALLPGVDR